LTFADEEVRVVAVGDGRQAIDRIDQEPPDIVLADVGMPGCDGYEVAAFVKNRPDLARIPVLLLTGAFEPVDDARVRQVRADGVLAKPFEPQELITRVKALLGLGAAPTVSEAQLPPPAPADLAPGAAPGSGVSLDDYFDRLDAAFASLSVPSHIDEAAGVPPSAPEPAWHGHDLPADAASSSARPEGSAAAGADRAQPASPPAGGLTPSAAFAALLEAEQAGLTAPPPGLSQGSLGLPPAYPPVEDLVEAVARRVIEQLSDRTAREAVADAVADVAERLVRQEIERLKASIT
jgi:CheY-like chemotaxis protein